MGKYADALMGGESSPEQTGAGKYSSQLLDSPPIAQSAPVEAKPEGWGEWLKNSVMGRQDPREAGTGTVYEQFTPELKSPTATAAMLGASDAQMGDVVRNNLGDRFVRQEKDANGYDVFVTKGADGQEQRGYLNKPGLDMQDVWRGVYSLPLYAGGAGAARAVAGKAAGWGARGVANALGTGVASLAGDAAQIPLGSEQGFELPKAAINAGTAGIAEPASALGSAIWRRFVTIPGLVDAEGKLTAKGLEAAQKAGLNSSDLNPDFARKFAESYSRSADPSAAATQATLDRYGIQATRGQVTKDKQFLHQEEAARWGTYGEDAKLRMQEFDKRQAEAIRQAALGRNTIEEAITGTVPKRGTGAPQQGIGEQIAPGRTPGTYDMERSSSFLGENVQGAYKTARQNVKATEKELWKGVDDLKATPEAMAGLPEKLNSALVNETALTPTAQKMDELLSGFVDGNIPTSAGKVLKTGKPESLNAMRKALFDTMSDAPPGSTDARQAKLIYDSFNDWIGESAEKMLLAGDPEAALNMVKGRAFHRDAMSVFKPVGPDGRPSIAASRLKTIENADSGEEVIKALIGSRGSQAQSGVVGTLKNLKVALDRYAPETASQAWGDVGLAYWSRIVTGKNGEMLGPQAISNNIKTAMQEQSSIVKTLYDPKLLGEIRRFEVAVNRIAYKPPNASGSSYGAANFIKEWVGRIVSAMMDSRIAGTVANAAIDKSGLRDAYGRTVVNSMMRAAPSKTPNLAPYASAVSNQSSGPK